MAEASSENPTAKVTVGGKTVEVKLRRVSGDDLRIECFRIEGKDAQRLDEIMPTD